MKEEKYYIALDDNEYGMMFRALNDERTALLNSEKSTDGIDDLIIKVGHAPKKKIKVIERGDIRESR